MHEVTIGIKEDRDIVAVHVNEASYEVLKKRMRQFVWWAPDSEGFYTPNGRRPHHAPWSWYRIVGVELLGDEPCVYYCRELHGQ